MSTNMNDLLKYFDKAYNDKLYACHLYKTLSSKERGQASFVLELLKQFITNELKCDKDDNLNKNVKELISRLRSVFLSNDIYSIDAAINKEYYIIPKVKQITEEILEVKLDIPLYIYAPAVLLASKEFCYDEAMLLKEFYQISTA